MRQLSKLPHDSFYKAGTDQQGLNEHHLVNKHPLMDEKRLYDANKKHQEVGLKRPQGTDSKFEHAGQKTWPEDVKCLVGLPGRPQPHAQKSYLK